MRPNVTDSSGDRFSRVFDVLELLVGHTEGMTLTEIVSHLGLPMSSAHNLLQRMAATDVVTMTEDLRYTIGARAVRIGIRIVGELDVRAAARRSLQDLARETGDDVYLAMRIGNRVSYVDRFDGSKLVSVDIRLGQSLFLHATSVGKLFTAHVPALQRLLFSRDRPKLTSHTLVRQSDLEREFGQIREDGFALSQEEALLGIVGLAVPVYNSEGQLEAALHVSTLRSEFTRARQAELLAASTAAAVNIGRELGRIHTPEAVRGPRNSVSVKR